MNNRPVVNPLHEAGKQARASLKVLFRAVRVMQTTAKPVKRTFKGRSELSYRKEIRRLKELIAEMHWVQPMSNSSPSCGYCGVQQHLHAEHCEISKLMEDTFGPDERRLNAVNGE
jgi:hypothetical protein